MQLSFNETLKLICSQDRIGHAYLLYGHGDKMPAARYFAAAILCKGQNKPCGMCESCGKITSGNHADVITHQSNGNKDSFHIKQVREICSDAYIMPNESSYKVYIIDNADTMTKGAYNAFLKMLEEPPKHAIFILVCQEKSALPETVLSRLYPILIQAQEAVSEVDITGVARQIADKNEYKLLLELSAFEKDKLLFIEMCDCLIDLIRRSIYISIGANGQDNTICVEFSQRFSTVRLMQFVRDLEEAKLLLKTNVSISLVSARTCAALI